MMCTNSAAIYWECLFEKGRGEDVHESQIPRDFQERTDFHGLPLFSLWKIMVKGYLVTQYYIDF